MPKGQFEKTGVLSGVSIASVQEIVDQAMSYLPVSLDLSKAEDREKIRQWVIRVCGVAIDRNADSLEAVMCKAIKEAARLAVNPDYYQQKEARKRKRAAAKKDKEIEARKSSAEMAFDRIKSTAVKM